MELKLKFESFEDAKQLLEKLLLDTCPDCAGVGNGKNLKGEVRRCSGCHGGGMVLNHLADALIEFLQENGDFARREHGHNFDR